MIGQALSGTYRLIDLLGSGGYADLYLARDLRSNAVVALNVLHPHVAGEPEVAASFEREAALARRLQSPHVARVLDASQDADSPPYLVTEHAPGLTLAELLRRHGPFPISGAVQTVDQILHALEAAHALGLVHRDVTPRNLVMDGAGHLTVLGFGVAVAGALTASGQLLGTPEYLAPEQAAGRAVDDRTDLYAAGAVLYEVLGGRPPFLRSPDSDSSDLVRRIQHDEPPPIRELRPEVPPGLAAVVERALAKDPIRRFQSASDMRGALAVAAGFTPQATASSASPAREPESTRPLRTPDVGIPPALPLHARRAGLRPWQLAGLGLGAVALLIVGAVLGRVLPLPGGTPAPTSAPSAIAAATSTTPPAAPGAAVQVRPTASAASPTVPQPASAASAPTVPPRPTNAPGVLLADTFDVPEIGQLPRVSARAADYTFAYDRGEYVINKLNAALPAAPVVMVPGSYDNSVIAVDVRMPGDVTSRYAFVVCRDQSTGGQTKQYRASIVPDGRRLILGRWDDGSQRVLAETRDDPGINPGSEVNRLELRCDGTKITASANGTATVSADDTTLTRGDHGLGAGTFAGVEGAVEAHFDNLEVKVP